MVEISREMQKQITREHLQGGSPPENWLIPFAITLSITLLAVLAMVIMHVLKRCRANGPDVDLRNDKGYKHANTDSDEMLTFSAPRRTDDELLVETHEVNVVRANEQIIVQSHRQVSPNVWSSSPPGYVAANMQDENWEGLSKNMPSSNL
ncbi:unnamed protein product [Clavelina lepadiformis]|uniref:Uncharacterized protein n=1 Tax=Clavelina lepadiformis TaxID=159417 RepID=A0ABP0G4H2_CLALP